MKLIRNYLIFALAIVITVIILAGLALSGQLRGSSETVVNPADLWETNLSESAAEGFQELLDRAIDNGTLTENADLRGATVYQLQTRTKKGTLLCAYYFHITSMINRTAYLQHASTGDLLKLSTEDFEEILSHPALTDAAKNRIPTLELLLTVGEEPSAQATPGTKDLSYYTVAGTFEKERIDAPDSTQDPAHFYGEWPPTLKIAEQSPDRWDVTITDGNGAVTQYTNVTEEELVFPSEGGLYTYTVTARWEVSTERDWFGETTYEFSVTLSSKTSEARQ